MKKLAALALLSVVIMLFVAIPSDAWAWHRGPHFGTRVVIGGPVWWGPPYWYYPPTYVYAPPPPVVVEQPPVYVQQSPPAPAPPPVAQGFWYYCAGAKSYYPNVQTCQEEWIKVPPR